jgi:glutamate synthase domain-containing protein 1
MTDRGPDSAGIALYDHGKTFKITVSSSQPARDFNGLAEALCAACETAVDVTVNDSHAILSVEPADAPMLREALAQRHPNLRIMSAGSAIEIYKETGSPESVTARFGLHKMGGTHGIGHTRMATESAVTTMGAHPFSTGSDQCLVHNGSLSNHNSLRRALAHKGVHVNSENDSEVAAAYLTYRMNAGDNLGQALESSLDDLDGFFTFVVGTENGFGVLRDPIACKPAVLAETDDYVAFGSEYRALVGLPGITHAQVWEPEPATVYFWEN